MRKPPHVLAPGLILAAPASGSGKTTLALGLIAALKGAGLHVGAFKVGPDYIDPAFHAAASGRLCPNLDPWAMRRETLDALMAELSVDSDIVIGEGVMGLFDGAPDGTGSTADLAARFALPIILVIDASRQGASVAALAEGFARHRADVAIAGIVLNRVGSANHEATLRRALEAAGLAVIGALPRDEALALSSRHLGLIQAREHAALDAFITNAAETVARHVDLEALKRAAAISRTPFLVKRHALAERDEEKGQGEGSSQERPASIPLPPLGQRIAIARDDAFAFSYPHVLNGWRRAGATLSFFSPLANEAPPSDSDAVYLPGGYPELHAGWLATATRFMSGLRNIVKRGTTIYGECGGYMTLGQGLIDANGARHAMAGLLPLETSFATRKLRLGYRAVTLLGDGPLGRRGAAFKGHEFHYATIISEGDGAPLFDAHDASGTTLGSIGRRVGTVFGSFVHLIDQARTDGLTEK